MNYLAHAFLSFNEPAILTGNMISDFVKGNKIYNYEQAILNGIKLHRSIDAFTDAHAATKEVRTLFSAEYGLYSAVYTDVVFDYFLANEFELFSATQSLRKFTSQCYQQLDGLSHLFPDNFAFIYPSMKSHDWLFNSQFEFGIEKSFASLARRAKYMDDSTKAFDIFLANKNAIRHAFMEMFPLLKEHAWHTLQELLKND